MHKVEMFVIVARTMWTLNYALILAFRASYLIELPASVAGEKLKGKRIGETLPSPISPPLSMTHLFQCLPRLT